MNKSTVVLAMLLIIGSAVVAPSMAYEKFKCSGRGISFNLLIDEEKKMILREQGGVPRKWHSYESHGNRISYEDGWDEFELNVNSLIFHLMDGFYEREIKGFCR